MLSQAGMYGKKKDEKASANKGRGIKFDLVFTYGYIQFSESDKEAIEAIPDLAEELWKLESEEKSMLAAFSLGCKSIGRLRNKQAALPNLQTICDMREEDITARIDTLKKELEKEAAFNSWDQHLGRNKLATEFFTKIEVSRTDGKSHVFTDFENFRQFIEDGCQHKKLVNKRPGK